MELLAIAAYVRADSFAWIDGLQGGLENGVQILS